MIKFIKKESISTPSYGSSLASGFDVVANNIIKAFKGDAEIIGEKLEKMKQGFIERGYIKLRPFERVLFGTGLKVADCDPSYEIQVRARSGVALKRGLLIANSPGTIDADYRGDVGIILYNSTPFLNKVEKNERIAQLVPMVVTRPIIHFDAVEVIETERGEKGFGSSGQFQTSEMGK